MALREEFRTQGNFLFKNRSYLPVLIILPGLWVFKQGLSGFDSDWTMRWELICLAISILGLVIRMVAVGYSAENTSGRNTNEGQIADHINTTGPYSIVRHPLYLGNYFMWLGIACMTRNFWFIMAFTFVYWLYYERIMYAEEEFLRDKYGDRYINWAVGVPAFIPAFSQWKKSQLSFSWVKIIRQEKAGILNLFIVFFVFKLLEAYFSNGDIMQFSRVWFYALLASLFWYVMIKSFQKMGKLKNDR